MQAPLFLGERELNAHLPRQLLYNGPKATSISQNVSRNVLHRHFHFQEFLVLQYIEASAN